MLGFLGRDDKNELAFRVGELFKQLTGRSKIEGFKFFGEFAGDKDG